MTTEDYGMEYQELELVGGRKIRVPVASHKASLRMPRELFFTNTDDSTFGVRYTDGTEKIVEDNERNRRFYSEMIEIYREKMAEPWSVK
jgi:hypothetical protein